jgi:hypothetical protein
MPAIYTPLSSKVFEALRIDARKNRRDPRDQAAVLIEQALGLRPECECSRAQPHQPSTEEANAAQF